jgi:hypothetical protein
MNLGDDSTIHLAWVLCESYHENKHILRCCLVLWNCDWVCLV